MNEHIRSHTASCASRSPSPGSGLSEKDSDEFAAFRARLARTEPGEVLCHPKCGFDGRSIADLFCYDGLARNSPQDTKLAKKAKQSETPGERNIFDLQSLECNQLSKRMPVVQDRGFYSKSSPSYIDLLETSLSSSIKDFLKSFNPVVASLFMLLAEKSQKKLPECLASLEGRRFVASVLSYFEPTCTLRPNEPSSFAVDLQGQLAVLNANGEKRKDDRLRWFFKRLVKHLLFKHTSYKQSKKHRVENYVGLLAKEYFPRNKKALNQLGQIKFASKKKLLELFGQSPKFKQESIYFLRECMVKEHAKELLGSLSTLYEIYSTCKSNKKKSDVKNFFRNSSVKITWLPSEVSSLYPQVDALFL